MSPNTIIIGRVCLSSESKTVGKDSRQTISWIQGKQSVKSCHISIFENHTEG